MNDPRVDAIGWTEYFQRVARLTSLRSKDPSTQVGCVIVSPEKKIIGTGYNGMVSCKENDTLFPWGKGEGVNNKKHFVVHAEANAILNATGSLKNARIFCTRFPCAECAKLICQSGIKIVYFEGTIDLDPNAEYCQLASTMMLDACNVKCKPLTIL